MAVYQDFNELMRSLRRHIATTGHMPRCNDQPRLLRVGWLDDVTGETWECGIVNLKNWLSGLPDAQARAYGDIMRSIAGREQFTQALMREAEKEKLQAQELAESEESVPTFWERLLSKVEVA